VRERADQPARAVHVQIAGGPDHGASDVGGEHGILVGELVQHARRTPAAPSLAVVDGQVVEPLARLAVVGDALVQVLRRPVALQQRQQRVRRLFTPPTSPTSMGVRRPSCSPRMSTWITVAFEGRTAGTESRCRA
jgi:hypothetical protein